MMDYWLRGRLVVFLAVWAAALGEQTWAQGPGTTPELPEIGGSASLMGSEPGAGGGSYANVPGTGGYLGGRAGTTAPKGVPTSIVNPASAPSPTVMQMGITAPQPEPVGPTSAPLSGPLEFPSGREDQDGPPDGLTLEAAIDITLSRSRDLRSKYYEIPQAKADILQASLRANPVFYQDGQLLAYPGYHFNRTVPGGPSQYDTNITFLLDVTRQRQARTMVAARAEKVLEAQYQEAVRQRIDDVYDAYVLGALSARQMLRYSRTSVRGLEALYARYQDLYRG
ncbi:MAG: TolC family protein, partial [Isosphaeraceae bacterium]